MAIEHPHHRIGAKQDAHAEQVNALLARTPAVITPGHTFDSVTDSISHTVLSKKTPIGWFLGCGAAASLLCGLLTMWWAADPGST